MRSAKQFLDEMHRKAAEIRRQCDRRQIFALTAGNTVLLGILVLRIGSLHRLETGSFAGSSLLDEDIGGFVAVALIAFMLGSAVTVLIRRSRKK